jgi:hypothetical protein
MKITQTIDLASDLFDYKSIPEVLRGFIENDPVVKFGFEHSNTLIVFEVFNPETSKIEVNGMFQGVR